MAQEADEQEQPCLFQALDENLTAGVFGRLDDIRDVCSLRAVCTGFRDTVDARQVAEAVFCGMWGLAALRGERKSSQYLAGVKLRNFVYEHPCGPSDTLAGIALKHGLSVLALRQLNNCPETSFKSRQHLYVPVSNGRGLEGRTATVVRDRHSMRELVVIDQGAAPAPEGVPPSARRGRDEARAKLAAELLSRSLSIDMGTAEFYLKQADGNLKEAMRTFEADRQWERSQGRRLGRRRAGKGPPRP